DLANAEQTRGGAVDQLRESEKAVSEAHRALFALSEQRRGLQAEEESIARRARRWRASRRSPSGCCGSSTSRARPTGCGWRWRDATPPMSRGASRTTATS